MTQAEPNRAANSADHPTPSPRHERASRNIELKTRLDDLERARAIALELCTKRLGTQHQCDTYFRCSEGRLKLRQIDGLSSVLIAYARPDATAAKASAYHLVPVTNPETLKQALAAALGVSIVVEKHREIYLWHNVRIHLDRVVDLGAFLEFEAVLHADVPESQGYEQLAFLEQAFSLRVEDRLAGSYADLLAAQCGPMTPNG